MADTHYLWLWNNHHKKQIQGNTEEGAESSLITCEEKRSTYNMITMFNANNGITAAYDANTGDVESNPSAGNFSCGIKWDNSMTGLWDTIMYGDSIDAQAFFFRQGKGEAEEEEEPEFRNWFTVNMYDGRLTTADLYKPEKAGEMGEEMLYLSMSFKAIRFAEHGSGGSLKVVAPYNWAEKAGGKDKLPNLRG